jgi:hypothetical protein
MPIIYRESFARIEKTATFVDYSSGYKLEDFQCKDPDYALWLKNDAPYYIQQNISRVKLLINKPNNDIMCYMALCSDSFRLSDEEKIRMNLNIPYKSVPALKVGKLATDIRYEGQSCGTYMLWLALGIADEMNTSGIACRFLTLDADITVESSTPKFYERLGFVYNEMMNSRRTDSVSMRYDIFV